MNPIINAILTAIRNAPADDKEALAEAIVSYQHRYARSYDAIKKSASLFKILLDALEEMLDVRFE